MFNNCLIGRQGERREMVMKFLSKNSFLKTFILSFISILFFSGCTEVEQLTRLTTKPTPSAGPTIEQAQKEEYMGPKARVAVIRFEDKSAKGKATGQIGDGMAEMLAHALFATNRYIVLERQRLEDVTREQDLGASGRARPEGAPPIGEIETADLLIYGTITEFEPGSAGGGAGAGGVVVGGGGLGGLFGIQASHVALVITGIDARTSRRVFSEQVEGKAIDVGGLIGGFGGPLAGALAGFAKTPMEKAIRVAIEEAVKVIVAKTPAEYYRVPATPQTKVTTVSPTEPPKAIQPPPPEISTPPQSPPASQPSIGISGPAHRTTQVMWDSVNLREGPGTKYKIIGNIKKGTSLIILGEQGDWLFVRLEDGKEAWVSKKATSEATKK
jgi:curli biogenesis system outer membrane secretion channel CsgG